ncbi:MAG: DUF58 domain-containing protein [Hyphomicrobium sp.]|uniref:DUF58 domain-containing protein n=1 Tax=Hyphomicrobium sp. TaxID=82 RepID=UPI0039E5D3AF
MASPLGRKTPGGEGPGPETRRVLALEREAVSLVDRMPELLMEAARIASTVAQGIHGRRRAGPGETFWQFRQYQPGENANLVDWRRSASSDHLYVREREWEAAHTLYLWPDVSPSMDFKSHLAPISKRDRALVLALASAELLVRGGERVALLAQMLPTASRNAVTRIAETIVANANSQHVQKSLPPNAGLNRFSGVILFSDFLAPVHAIRERLESYAGNGVGGHLVQIIDPAEETLPYQGRTEFLTPSGSQRWVADRVESLRPKYQARFAAHRAELAEMTKRFGWSLLTHHTDRPASEPLLSLLMRLNGSAAGYRWMSSSSDAVGSGHKEPAR